MPIGNNGPQPHRNVLPVSTSKEAGKQIVRNSADHQPRVGVPEQVRATAERLFQGMDPTNPSSPLRALRDEFPNVYAPGVTDKVSRRLSQVVETRSRMFLQGSVIGVGASTLVTDYANAFNILNAERGDPRRIVKLNIFPGAESTQRFLGSLAKEVRAPVTTTELRFQSPHHVAQRILEGRRELRVATIIIDHIHNASEKIRGVIASLMMVTDPRYQVVLEPEEFGAAPRIGVVLVDHIGPDVLFRRHTEVLALLNSGREVLPHYTELEDVAEAIRQAGIGLEDLDLDDIWDREIAEQTRHLSRGLIAQMGPLLGAVGAIRRMSGVRRPSLHHFEAAVPYVNQFLDVRRYQDPSGKRVSYEARARSITPSAAKKAGGSEGSDPEAKPKKKSPTDRQKALQRKARDRLVAEDEGRKMRKRGHINLP